MSKAIYITTNEPHSGKSTVTLGMMSMLIGKATKVGYFRPIIEDTEDDKIDSHIQTVIDYFKLNIPYEDAYAITKSKLIKEKNSGNIDSVIDLIIEKYKALEDKFDFVLVEGTSFSGEGTAIELDINVLIDIYKLIDESIDENAPFSVREGNIIKRGYNSELDDIFKIMNSGKEYLLEIEQREREKTGIKNMKIKYNKVFGYFIEVTNSNLNLIPDDYIRKQTLSNAERFITPELKKYEDTIINAKAKIEDLEYYLFKEVSDQIKNYKKDLMDLAEKLAYLDIIVSFASLSIENNYVKPNIIDTFDLEIINGRHPVVEKLIGREEYVANNVRFDEKERFMVLTGPNMAGKSTYMKQVALVSIMAQIGCFVPAESAKIPIIDKFLTRIGASDDILSGQSTFMVEMSEVSNIINNATENSLIILDEVGRGTSTFDGISIATAISEYIHDKIKAKTIFATHYHELTDLENKFENVVNYRIEVEEKGNKVIFLRTILKGGADKSYGLEVARLAGLPKEVLLNGKKILRTLEQRKKLIEKTISVEQLSLFGTEAMVDEIEEEIEDNRDKIIEDIIYDFEIKDINNMTPMEALTFLSEIKVKIEEIK